MAQLIECLPGVHETLVQLPECNKLGVVVAYL